MPTHFIENEMRDRARAVLIAAGKKLYAAMDAGPDHGDVTLTAEEATMLLRIMENRGINLRPS